MPHQHLSPSAPVGGVTMGPGTFGLFLTLTLIRRAGVARGLGILVQATHLIDEVIRTQKGLQAYPESHSHLMAEPVVGALRPGHTPFFHFSMLP